MPCVSVRARAKDLDFGRRHETLGHSWRLTHKSLEIRSMISLRLSSAF